MKKVIDERGAFVSEANIIMKFIIFRVLKVLPLHCPTFTGFVDFFELQIVGQKIA